MASALDLDTWVTSLKGIHPGPGHLGNNVNKRLWLLTVLVGGMFFGVSGFCFSVFIIIMLLLTVKSMRELAP